MIQSRWIKNQKYLLPILFILSLGVTGCKKDGNTQYKQVSISHTDLSKALPFNNTEMVNIHVREVGVQNVFSTSSPMSWQYRLVGDQSSVLVTKTGDQLQISNINPTADDKQMKLHIYTENGIGATLSFTALGQKPYSYLLKNEGNAANAFLIIDAEFQQDGVNTEASLANSLYIGIVAALSRANFQPNANLARETQNYLNTHMSRAQTQTLADFDRLASNVGKRGLIQFLYERAGLTLGNASDLALFMQHYGLSYKGLRFSAISPREVEAMTATRNATLRARLSLTLEHDAENPDFLLGEYYDSAVGVHKYVGVQPKMSSRIIPQIILDHYDNARNRSSSQAAGNQVAPSSIANAGIINSNSSAQSQRNSAGSTVVLPALPANSTNTNGTVVSGSSVLSPPPLALLQRQAAVITNLLSVARPQVATGSQLDLSELAIEVFVSAMRLKLQGQSQMDILLTHTQWSNFQSQAHIDVTEFKNDYLVLQRFWVLYKRLYDMQPRPSLLPQIRNWGTPSDNNLSTIYGVVNFLLDMYKSYRDDLLRRVSDWNPHAVTIPFYSNDELEARKLEYARRILSSLKGGSVNDSSFPPALASASDYDRFLSSARSARVSTAPLRVTQTQDVDNQARAVILNYVNNELIQKINDPTLRNSWDTAVQAYIGGLRSMALGLMCRSMSRLGQITLPDDFLYDLLPRDKKDYANLCALQNGLDSSSAFYNVVTDRCSSARNERNTVGENNISGGVLRFIRTV